ncbi:MAG: aldo/keto reductase [Phycisphaerae bacterium]|nr:aldo/keto reductase [Phycisphaerae bacterium]
MDREQNQQFTRRAFLRTTAAGAAATGIGALATSALAGAEIAAKRPLLPAGVLGRTGFPVTLISFGSIRIGDKLGTRILKLAIDRGVNLVHTAANYSGGKAIRSVGDLFKADKSYREKVFLCIKSYYPDRESEIDDLLKTLNVEHAEAALTELHEPDPARLEAIQRQQDSLKKKGKVRYTGFVCHKDMNGTLEMVLDRAPKYFDMALLSMAMIPGASGRRAQPAAEKGERFLKNLKALREKGVGVLSMKSGAQEATTKGETVFLPHAKLVLEAGADSVLTSVSTLDQVDMIAELALKSPHTRPADKQAAIDFLHTRSGACMMCGDCTKSCPQNLPVADLMRFRMYNDEYGWPDHARAEYAAMGVDFAGLTARCGDCQACAKVCPVHLASPATVRDAARRLA